MKGLEIEIERTTRGKKRKGMREYLSPIPENPLDTEEDYADPGQGGNEIILSCIRGAYPEREEERERER